MSDKNDKSHFIGISKSDAEGQAKPLKLMPKEMKLRKPPEKKKDKK